MPELERPPLIQHLAPKNLLSFGPDNPGIELQALNLLVGPNGSGKSNFIEAIGLMRAAPKDWRDVTRKGGGVMEWIWKGAPSGTASISATFRDRGAVVPIVHEMSFRAEEGRFALGHEKLHDKNDCGEGGNEYYWSDAGSAGPMAGRTASDGEQYLEPAPQTGDQSILAHLRGPHYPEITWLAEKYEGIRIYREWAFGRNSVYRAPQRADMRSDVLEEDCSNLGLVLSRLRRTPRAKKAIVAELQNLYAGISDFDVSVEGGAVQVFFTEGDYVIPATRLSDGTLRYLCLLAILCDPEPPPLICIEEPELGLHPDILPGVADLLRVASERTQLIVTTHSDILVDAMTETPECVVVCEKHDGETEMSRLSAAELAVWLEKYRLGDLWIKGQLGGKRW